MTDSELEFQHIYEAFQPKIHRYLARLTGADEADDLTQEVFIKISLGLKGFRGESKLSSWIYRIATNAALDHLRRPPQTTTEISSIGTERDEEPVRLQGKVSFIDQQLIRKEMNACIRNVIKKLPEDYRTVIVLGELEEFKNHEIAEILGISLDAVKIRLHRARASLRKQLEAHCSFYRDGQNEFACDLKNSVIEFRKR